MNGYTKITDSTGFDRLNCDDYCVVAVDENERVIGYSTIATTGGGEEEEEEELNKLAGAPGFAGDCH